MSNCNSLEKLVAKRPLSGAKAILSKFIPVSIDGALSICQILDCDKEVFLWEQQRITMEQMIIQYFPGTDLNQIPIKFYGGPIGRGSWHTGSIITFLLDHLANQIIIDGYLKTKAKFNLTSAINVV